MESFWHSMTVEDTHGQDLATRAEATHSVFGYVEGWHNTTRMHSSLGYHSPAQFERARNANLRVPANDEPTTIPSDSGQTAPLNKPKNRSYPTPLA